MKTSEDPGAICEPKKEKYTAKKQEGILINAHSRGIYGGFLPRS